MCDISKIKYKVHGRDGNIVQGEAECYITIKAKRRILHSHIAQARQCFK